MPYVIVEGDLEIADQKSTNQQFTTSVSGLKGKVSISYGNEHLQRWLNVVHFGKPM